MTVEEYLINRIEQLELENKLLRQENENLKNDKKVIFLFEDYDMNNSYKVKFVNGHLEVFKED